MTFRKNTRISLLLRPRTSVSSVHFRWIWLHLILTPQTFMELIVRKQWECSGCDVTYWFTASSSTSGITLWQKANIPSCWSKFILQITEAFTKTVLSFWKLQRQWKPRYEASYFNVSLVLNNRHWQDFPNDLPTVGTNLRGTINIVSETVRENIFFSRANINKVTLKSFTIRSGL